jgi:hypothetical protein
MIAVNGRIVFGGVLLAVGTILLAVQVEAFAAKVVVAALGALLFGISLRASRLRSPEALVDFVHVWGVPVALLATILALGAAVAWRLL